MLPAWTHATARRLAGRDLGPAWLDERWFAARGVGLASPLPRGRRRDALRELLYGTLVTSSLPMLLRYEDRNSMAHSIESRVPFLTPALAEYVLALPEEYLVADDGTSKAVFRQAMRGIVPDAVLDRRDKIGFATPERRWLGELRPWVEGVLSGATAREVGGLRPDAALAEWRRILSGERRFDWHVWRWLNTIRWAERYGVRFDG
jgi:asparagine synthase (glutamine-hydrolysing)